MGGGLQKFQMESMEWGMDSILFPWNGGWTPYIFKMDSMEWWMDSIIFPWNGGWTSYFLKMEWGMDSMDWGMDSIFFIYLFHKSTLRSMGLSSFEFLVKLSIYTVFNKTTYINLF